MKENVEVTLKSQPEVFLVKARGLLQPLSCARLLRSESGKADAGCVFLSYATVLSTVGLLVLSSGLDITPHTVAVKDWVDVLAGGTTAATGFFFSFWITSGR